MNYSNLILSMALICFATFSMPSGYGKFAVSPLTTSHNATAQLRLETNIVEREYCSNDQLCLTLRLTFTNAGDQPIILDKKSSVIGRYLVSRSLHASAAKKYVENICPFLDATSILRVNATPEESSFVILTPGESYCLDKKIGLFIYDGTKDNEDLLHSGDYFLEIVVLTWYYPQALKANTSRKWKEKGYLWTGSDKIKSITVQRW